MSEVVVTQQAPSSAPPSSAPPSNAVSLIWQFAIPIAAVVILGIAGVGWGIASSVRIVLETSSAPVPVHGKWMAIAVGLLIVLPPLVWGLVGVTAGLATTLVPIAVYDLVVARRRWHHGQLIVICAAVALVPALAHTARHLILLEGMIGREVAVGLVLTPYFALQGMLFGAELWLVIWLYQRRSVRDLQHESSLGQWVRIGAFIVPLISLPMFYLLPVYVIQLPLLWLTAAIFSIHNIRHKIRPVSSAFTVAFCLAALAVSGYLLSG